MRGPELYPTPPWKPHRFPHRRIVRKVVAAKLTYPCGIQGPRPPDCHRSIAKGSRYLRVSIRPDREGSSRWRAVRLCPACAVHLGLAVTERPEDFA